MTLAETFAHLVVPSDTSEQRDIRRRATVGGIETALDDDGKPVKLGEFIEKDASLDPPYATAGSTSYGLHDQATLLVESLLRVHHACGRQSFAGTMTGK